MDTAAAQTVNVVRFLAWPLVLVIVSLTLGLAIVLRRCYVAALIRLQRGASICAATFPSSSPPAAPLRIVFKDACAQNDQIPLPVRSRRLRRRILFIEFVCALTFWSAFLIYSLLGDRHLLQDLSFFAATVPPLSDWRNSMFLWLYIFWPPLIFTFTQAAVDKKYTLLAVAAAALVFALQTLSNASFWQALGPDKNALSIFQVALLAGVLGVFAVMLTLLQNPRLRGAAAPLVVALTLSAMLWLSIGIAITAVQGELQSSVDDDTMTAGDVLSLTAFVLPVIVSAAAVLFRLAVQYEKKRYSDIELGQVAFWLLMTLAAFGSGSFTHIIGTLIDLCWQIAALVVCWFVYRGVRRWLLRRIARAAAPAVGSLLVLRVFKTAAKSEIFYTRLFSYWRFAAPVRMIAGADLAEANLEPDKFFALLRRRLPDEFIRSADQIEPRVDALDERRDPDGRFRVTELFCADETWRSTVESLIRRAGAILLDLREYTPDRSGTRYEIHQLMSLAPLNRLVVVASERDDRRVISAELASAWETMSDASPNRCVEAPAVEVFRLRSGSTKEVRSVFGRLAAIARQAA